MAEKILVLLKRHDRVEEVVPYIEKVTQPGTSVVFLIHYLVNSFKWLQAYCGIMGCSLERTLAIRRMVESYSVKMRRQLAQQNVFHTCEALHKLGVKVAVEIYSGSLRETLRRYVLGGDVDLIVMRPGILHRIVNFLQGVVSIRNIIRRTAFSPVFVFNPKAYL